jgi:hypothetical protein
VLDVAADVVSSAPASWYCGCCGLVLASSAPDDAAPRAFDTAPS